VGKDFEHSSFLFGSNSVFIEELYQKYLQDPNSIDPSWAKFFAVQSDITPLKTTAKIIIQDKLVISSNQDVPTSSSLAENSLRAKFMIKAYREHGHYLANLDPLGLEVKKTKEELKLNLADFGFNANQLSELVDVSGEFDDLKIITLGELVNVLNRTYSGSVAVEFSHVENSVAQEWLYNKLDSISTHINLSLEEKNKRYKT